jgi:ubiquinol-cytochrome c reductase cytochrome b subunit
LTAVVGDPSHERFYGKDNDRMPSFARDEKLTDEEIGILVDWLRSKPSTNSEVR